MGVYFALIAIPIMEALFIKYLDEIYPNHKFQKNKIILGSFFVILITILCLRDVSCGIDLENYKIFWNSALNMSFKSGINQYEIETGYHAIEYFISRFTDDFQIFLSIVAILSIAPLWYFYKKESEMPILTILLFVTIAPFTMFFSGLRQAIAIAIAVPAFYLAKNKKMFCFIAIVILATLIHTSAVLLFVIYPLYHAKITKKWLLFVIPIIVVIFIFNEQIFSFMLRFLKDEYAERYSELESTGAYSVLILLILFGIYSFLIPDNEKLDGETIAMRNFLLFSICIQCFAPIHTLAMRMNYYFLIFIPILIPRIIKYRKQSLREVTQLSQVVFTLFFAVYFFYEAYTGADVLSIYPYIPFWKG